jgi:hypothetical protein
MPQAKVEAIIFFPSFVWLSTANAIAAAQTAPYAAQVTKV